VKTAVGATKFIADLGFTLLFPRRALALPSLWDVARDDELAIVQQWGPDIQRVWAWKDELPRTGRAWYGDFLAGQKSFLSPEMVALLYPRDGADDDWRTAELSPSALAVAEVLAASGPTPSSVLRELAGFAGPGGRPPYVRALTELGKALVVTHLGVVAQEEVGATGWPSAVIELTARAFPVPAPGPTAERQRAAARRFLDTMVAVRPRELARAFGWPAATAQAVLRELVESGEARISDALIVAARRSP
jgi:hypothetical protein